MMSRQTTVEKSSVYFALLEAFGKNGCPVCRIMEEASASYVDALFYEQVTDVGVRRKLRQAHGLCNWHSWRISQTPMAALGVAIIAQDLLEEECARLAELQRQPFWRRIGKHVEAHLSHRALLAYLRGWRRRSSCPACHAVQAHEQHALETLLNCLDDEVGARQFEASFGICVPHLVRAAAYCPSDSRLVALIEMQRGKQARLLAELEEFCRKHDYRFRDQAWGTESDAWQRAIEVLVGKANVFGNDLQRRPASRRRRFIQALQAWWGRSNIPAPRLGPPRQ